MRIHFCFRAPPGEYELYVVCGTSDPALRSQFFDFTVRVGAQQQRVQIEGAYQFRTLRFKATVGAGAEPFAVMFSPRSKWVVNALIAWTAADAETVRREVIEPFEQWTFRLAPQEWAKWQRDPVREEPMPPVSAADEQARVSRLCAPLLGVCLPGDTARARRNSIPELRLFATPGEFGTSKLRGPAAGGDCATRR